MNPLLPPSPIPTIETDRLILRGHRLEDFEAVAAMWSDPAVVKHIGGRGYSRSDCWLRFLRAAGHWAHMGYGFWVLEDRETGRFAGEAGLSNFKRDNLDPPFGDTPEMGWVLAPDAHGRGLGTEAVRAALNWGDAHFGAGSRTCCMIDVENTPSRRVAEKCGYAEYARADYQGSKVILLRRDAP